MKVIVIALIPETGLYYVQLYYTEMFKKTYVG